MGAGGVPGVHDDAAHVHEGAAAARRGRVPRALSAVGEPPAEPDGAVHILLVWDGARFKTSTRLSPIVLRGRRGRAASSASLDEAVAASVVNVVDGLVVQGAFGLEDIGVADDIGVPVVPLD